MHAVAALWIMAWLVIACQAGSKASQLAVRCAARPHTSGELQTHGSRRPGTHLHPGQPLVRPEPHGSHDALRHEAAKGYERVCELLK